MRRSTKKLAAISIAVFTLTGIVCAQESPAPAGGQGAAVQTTAPAGYVPVDQYNALLQKVDALSQRLDADEKRLPATQQVNTAGESSAGQLTPGEEQRLAGQDAGDVHIARNLDGTVKTLFAPRTDEEYFSPFAKMNPEHMRPDMPFELGSYQDLNVYMGLQTVGRAQALDQHDVGIENTTGPTAGSAFTSQRGLDPGFQTPFADLTFLGQIPNKMEVYFDEYIASRPHPSTTYGHEGYIVFEGMPAPLDTGPVAKVFDWVNVKVGAFDLDYGDDNYRRSNNARVQSNPLIGNPLVDPNVEEIGGEIYSVKGPIYGLFGVGGGSTTEHFDIGYQPSVHGKLWAYPVPEVRTSVSAYHVHLDRSADESYLYANGRSGGTFAGVFGNPDDPGQILPQAGKDVTATQGDVTWLHWPVELYSNIGWVQDANIGTNGAPAPTVATQQHLTPTGSTPSERWIYGAFEPVYHITPALYAAARFSVAQAQTVNGVTTHGWVDRAELGGGYWFTNNMLAKVEYVYEQFHDFDSPMDVVNGYGGLDGGSNPSFNGVVIEFSFAF